MARKPRGASASGKGAWFGNVTSNVAAALIVAALPAIGAFATGWLKVEKTADGGLTIARGRDEPPRLPAPPPIRLFGAGEGAAAARLAGDLDALVRPHLRTRTDGLTIRYRLANLAFAGGANRRLDARWSIGLPGKAGVACPAISVSFYSASNLAERLAERLNAGIAETERRGEPTCG